MLWVCLYWLRGHTQGFVFTAYPVCESCKWCCGRNSFRSDKAVGMQIGCIASKYGSVHEGFR